MVGRDQFGLNIAGILNDAFTEAGGGGPVVLVKETLGDRDPNNPGAGRTKTTDRYTATGTITEGIRRLGNTRVPIEGAMIKIFSALLPPNVEPKPGDVIEVGTDTWTIKTVEVGGTARASFLCMCNVK